MREYQLLFSIENPTGGGSYKDVLSWSLVMVKDEINN